MRATTAQKDTLRASLRREEYDMLTTGLFHVRLCERALIRPVKPGSSVEQWISCLTTNEASALIGELRG